MIASKIVPKLDFLSFLFIKILLNTLLKFMFNLKFYGYIIFIVCYFCGMTSTDIIELKEFLSNRKEIVIVTHKNPDGDAIGSSLALYGFLLKLNHIVKVIVPNDFPDFLKWMPCANNIIIFEQQKETAIDLIKRAELIFTLDFNSLSRAGEDLKVVLEESKATKIMIDHHQQPDNYAQFTYSDSTMCSTAQMIYHFLDFIGGLAYLDADIASCIYTGIMTDTGSFRFRSTTSTTHRVVATLIDAGANNTQIHENVYDANTPSRMKLLSVALNNLKILPEYHTAYITLSQKELDDNQYKKGDYEGFVNYALSVKNITLAVLFIENQEENIIRMSLRSKGAFSVNEMARKHFNGGGHDNAAGGRSDSSLTDTVARFISTLQEYKHELSI